MNLLNCESVRNKVVQTEKKISQLEKQIDKMPKGELLCCKNDERYKWYVKKNGKREYLPKEMRSLAETLALKKYCTYQLYELEKELDVCRYYLKKFENDTSAESLLLHEEWGELLKKYFESPVLELKKWQEQEYEHCRNHEENLVYTGTQKKKLRSKSEVIIDMLLNKYQIPFHYEEKLVLNGCEMYPDFTIKHPITHKIIYWEHFGMMDDEVYRNNACLKLKKYFDNGIIPTVHLITTYETNENPLDIDYVELIIKNKFLQEPIL